MLTPLKERYQGPGLERVRLDLQGYDDENNHLNI